MTLNLPAALYCPEPHVPLHYHFHKKGTVIAPFLLLPLHLEVSPFFLLLLTPPSFLLLLLNPSLSIRPSLQTGWKTLWYTLQDELSITQTPIFVGISEFLMVLVYMERRGGCKWIIPARIFHHPTTFQGDTKGPKHQSWRPWDSRDLWPDLIWRTCLLGQLTDQCREVGKPKKKTQQLRIHWLISHAFHRLCLYVHIPTGVLVFLHFTNSAFIVSFLGFISVILAHFNTAGMHTIATQVLMHFYLILPFEWPHFYTYSILLLNRPWALYPPMEITPFAVFVPILWITCFSKASTFH